MSENTTESEGCPTGAPSLNEETRIRELIAGVKEQIHNDLNPSGPLMLSNQRFWESGAIDVLAGEASERLLRCDDPWLKLARHEVAHACIAYHFRRPPKGVEIHQESTNRLRGTTFSNATGDPKDGIVVPSRTYVSSDKRLALNCLYSADQTAGGAVPRWPRFRARFKVLQKRAEDLVMFYADVICVLGERLREVKTMNRTEICAGIQAVLDARNQARLRELLESPESNSSDSTDKWSNRARALESFG